MLKIIVIVTLINGGSVRIEHTLQTAMRDNDTPWMREFGIMSCEEMGRTLFRYSQEFYNYPKIKKIEYDCNHDT